VTWYFDNVPLFTRSLPAAIDAQHYYLLFTMQMGNNWSEGNRSGVTASQMNLNVDWVHVSQAGATSPIP